MIKAILEGGLCNTAYLFFLQHHCHHCGKVFCEQCTSKTVLGSKSSRPHPVCDKCYVILNKDSTSTFYDTTLADDKRWLLWNGVLWLSYVTQKRRRIAGHMSILILLHADNDILAMSGIIFITVSRKVSHSFLFHFLVNAI